MASTGAAEGALEQASLLEIATLVARDAPEEVLFAAVAEHVAHRLGTEAASVLRYIGDERAVVVGVWREGGTRGLPVNAELDFDRTTSATGMVRSTRRPARVDGYEGHESGVGFLMRAVGLRSSVAAPVIVGDEVWGAVGAATTRDEPLPPDCEHRLVPFAELVAHAVARDEARRRLMASGRRLVEAADESRRRLERELQDGAHQHLLALTLKLRFARDRAGSDSPLAGLLEDAIAEATAASAALRELARGLFPILLSERGLAAALQALAVRAPVPVHLRELPSRRFPPLVEATAYFLIAEVLAASDAAAVAVIAGDRGDRLLVELHHDGGAARRLPGLADRVAAVGGTFEVGGGVLRAEIPLN